MFDEIWLNLSLAVVNKRMNSSLLKHISVDKEDSCSNLHADSQTTSLKYNR